MVTPLEPIVIRQIPVARITISNPRDRNRKSFDDLVESIAKLGLKRPITVAPGADGATYELVCGQGRLEAFVALGQHHIPAIIIDSLETDRLLRSIVENVARRQLRPLELLHYIGAMRERGYSSGMIAEKTGLSYGYVQQIGQLLAFGEHRLLIAVETGKIPLNVALDIAKADDANVQNALAAAYEAGHLRGAQVSAARRVAEQRLLRGKGNHRDPSRKSTAGISSDTLIRTYKTETERQRDLIRRADRAAGQLRFVVAAMNTLLADENYVTLLRAEGMDTLPQPVATLMKGLQP